MASGYPTTMPHNALATARPAQRPCPLIFARLVASPSKLELEAIPDVDLRAAGGADDVRDLQERVCEPLVTGRVRVVRPVGEVEEVGMHVERSLTWQRDAIARPEVDRHVVRPARAVG